MPLSSSHSPSCAETEDGPLSLSSRGRCRTLNRSLGKLYASEGRPSIPPEQLLSALLLQAFYGIRSERQLMEQLDYNLLYRWFVGLSPDDPESWSRLSEQNLRVDKWSVCRV